MSNAKNLALAAAVAGGLAPAGSVLPFAGSTAPSGWLLCAGQAVSRTTYAGLFAAIGTAYGAGDGSTTFAVPDLRGRVAGGKDNMGGTAANVLNVTLTGNKSSTSNGVITGLSSTSTLTVGMKAFGTGIGTNAVINSIDSSTQVTLSVNSTSTGSTSIRFGVVDGATLGATGGTQTHTLDTTQMPAHSHIQHHTGSGASSQIQMGGGGMGTTNSGIPTTAVGGGFAHNNMQPTLVLNYIIKA